jgi:hypothetical protein
MPGWGTMARVIKDPEEASQLPWHSICRPSTNYPTRPRGSRVGFTPCLGKANHSRRRHTVHLITTSESYDKATDWALVAQLPMYAKNPGTSPPSHASGHEASQ